MVNERKHSRKREAILKAIKNTKEHPSAEMLYAWLKPECPDLSLGTVYRNIALFLQNGEIISVGNVAGQERYDGNTSSHSHFICSSCRKVLDTDTADLLSELYAAVESSTNAVVNCHSLTFYGICPECRQQSANQPVHIH